MKTFYCYRFWIFWYHNLPSIMYMYYGTDFFVSTQIPITSTVGISPKLLVTLYMYLSYWLHVHYFFRSVTPTELNRRRHLSSTSSFDFDHMDPLVHFKELSMPRYLPESIIIPLLFCNGVTITVLDMFQIFFRYTYTCIWRIYVILISLFLA